MADQVGPAITLGDRNAVVRNPSVRSAPMRCCARRHSYNRRGALFAGLNVEGQSAGPPPTDGARRTQNTLIVTRRRTDRNTIAQIAERIARTHWFEDRVAVTSSDEVGELATSFNAMLDEIRRRDVDLARHRHDLEQQIAERNLVNAELREAKEKAESVTRLKKDNAPDI